MNRPALLLIVVVAVLGLEGCGKFLKLRSRSTPAVAQPQLVTARDGSCRVRLPAGWVERSADTGPAVLKVGEPTEEALFMAVRARKEDLAEGETYRDQGGRYVDDLKKGGQYSEFKIVAGPTDCEVNGRPAVRYEVDALLKKNQKWYTYFIAVVDGKKAIFKLVGTVTRSQTEKYRPAEEEVANSFTELP
jgi:hypothetical protein